MLKLFIIQNDHFKIKIKQLIVSRVQFQTEMSIVTAISQDQYNLNLSSGRCDLDLKLFTLSFYAVTRVCYIRTKEFDLKVPVVKIK